MYQVSDEGTHEIQVYRGNRPGVQGEDLAEWMSGKALSPEIDRWISENVPVGDPDLWGVVVEAGDNPWENHESIRIKDEVIDADKIYTSLCGQRPYTYWWSEKQIEETQPDLPWEFKRLNAIWDSIQKRGDVSWGMEWLGEPQHDPDACNEEGQMREARVTILSPDGVWSRRAYAVEGVITIHRDYWGVVSVRGAGRGTATVTSRREGGGASEYAGFVISNFIASMIGSLTTRDLAKNAFDEDKKEIDEVEGGEPPVNPHWGQYSLQALAQICTAFADFYPDREGDVSGHRWICDFLIDDYSPFRAQIILVNLVKYISAPETSIQVEDLWERWTKDPTEVELGKELTAIVGIDAGGEPSLWALLDYTQRAAYEMWL